MTFFIFGHSNDLVVKNPVLINTFSSKETLNLKRTTINRPKNARPKTSKNFSPEISPTKMDNNESNINTTDRPSMHLNVALYSFISNFER